MIHTNNEKMTEKTINLVKDVPLEVPSPAYSLTKNAAIDHKNQLPALLSSKLLTHHPKAGINPLVDAAAYIFSDISKIKQLPSHPDILQLHQELAAAIIHFQETARAQGYSSECILVSRYALCATLDDMIIHTPWGTHGQWEPYSLLNVFNQEAIQQDRFFLILDRIIKDSALYIDVMELMYICLSLGYKGSYRGTELASNQLEKITHVLYKHIRTYHDHFSKILSPPISKNPSPRNKKHNPKISLLLTFFMTTSIIMLLFISLAYILDTISSQTYQELIRAGKSVAYETPQS